MFESFLPAPLVQVLPGYYECRFERDGADVTLEIRGTPMLTRSERRVRAWVWAWSFRSTRCGVTLVSGPPQTTTDTLRAAVCASADSNVLAWPAQEEKRTVTLASRGPDLTEWLGLDPAEADTFKTLAPEWEGTVGDLARFARSLT